MSVISNNILAGSAGAAGGEGLYVDDVFSTYLYTGNDGTQTITNGIDLSDEGGMVWVKTRNSGYTTSFMDHAIVDTVRGDRILSSNSTADDTTWGTPSGFFPSFNSDGFTVGSGSALANHSSRNYVSWTFRKAPGFFDVVTYTGNGTAGREISHSLGSTPGMVIVKRLNGADNWAVQHRSLGGTKSLYLNKNDSVDTSITEWNNTAATSTVFTVGTSGKTNATGDTYVAYIFAHDDQSFGENGDEAIIKCGSYTGSTGSIQLNLGFEPQWVMIKRATGTLANYANWVILDNMRGVVSSGDDTPLAANLSTEEGGTYLYGTNNPANLVEFTPTGIHIDPTGTQYTAVNTYNETFVYVAIRRPHKPPEAGTDVFAATTDNSQGDGRYAYLGKPVDAWWYHPNRSGGSVFNVRQRLTGGGYLATSTTAAEVSQTINWWDNNVGTGSGAPTNTNAYSYGWRRAPGFFDVVAYTGTGSNQTINHNLAAIPELIIVKSRDAAYDWRVYVSSEGAQRYFELNSNAAHVDDSGASFGTTPTSSVFSVNTNYKTNESGTNFIAYLFATLPGVSKVGTYQGNNGTATIDIDCGFTNGARFVLIKDTTYTGHWYVWDSVRGIVSGTDPILKLDATDAELTTSDWIDPLSSGFQVSTAGTTVNTLNHTYLFLAIA